MSELRVEKNDQTANNVGPEKVAIFVMGKKYEVPSQLTIMKAMEHAGFKFIRGCGCRGGVCGACATVYRKPGDYKLNIGLACQTVVEDGMYLTLIPFYPANRAVYKYEELKPAPEEIFKLYPELFRCVACNACTKVCPMNIEVMDAISALKQGDIKKAVELTFDCIQCGLCASRCFGEIPQYHIFQLARRIYGGKIAPKAKHLEATVQAVSREKRHEELLKTVMKMSDAELKQVYQDREIEPLTGNEEWVPEDKRFLID